MRYAEVNTVPASMCKHSYTTRKARIIWRTLVYTCICLARVSLISGG